ncbi:TonB-dependent receptor [uncultured Bacteroides sp.]|uniref:SusC/RagA family TonB-linked outer membrane protein n=1 Tax=uncultured Bacteroides sp. TaxID=162156 RepID=UPI002637417D|nr:TonB-dependent receptor [uncultured Bacteroides sp.]
MKKSKKFKTGFSKKALLCAVCATYGVGISGASFNHANVADESYIVQQDGKTVTGVVMDNMGPVIGANVLVKGTTNGVITDFDGKFTLSNVPENAVLQISFIGYTTKEIKVAGKKDFSITLVEDAKTLEEVVVVGYGSQKKVNLTGAVGQIDSKVLESRPITSTTSALQGTIPNLQITNSSGEPGQSASINVRGTTSINGGSPLVLVDGVEMSLDLVNPNDIANVTVLKDAAASAIYGVRAAFGVILVTTKNPSKAEKTRINYSGNFSFAKPSIMPEFIESQSEFAKWMNQACVNGNVPTPFRDEVIAKMEAYEADPKNNPEYEVIDGQLYYYGYSNFKEKMVRNVTPTQRHNLNITGGSEKTKFYTSIGYLDQGGLYKVGDDSYKQLNTRINVENQTTEWMKLGVKALYNYSSTDKPFSYEGKSVWQRVVYSLPTDFIDPWQKDSRYPELDKFAGRYMENNPYDMLNNGGRNKSDRHDIWLTASADLDILKGWKAHIDFNYNLNYNKSSEHSKPIMFFDKTFQDTYGRTATSYYKMTNANKSYYSFNAYTEYENTFAEKHYLKLMVGFNQELTKYSTFSGKRYDILNNDLPSLSLGSGNHETSQNGYEWALRGGFFRANYIYNDRYLFELNGRYDGTSRFPSDNRFVFLPSFSGAWRLSEEAFMEGTRSWLDNLKLRATYGILGNQLISSSDWSGNTKYYPYIPFMSSGTSTNWIFGDTYATVINPGNLVSNNLTWEKVSTINGGIDATFFNQRLDMSFDYYVRTTSDMLIKVSYPGVLGTSAPPANAAELKTRGWELSLKWRDRIGENFGYELGFILSDSQAEITKYNNPTGDISTYYEGKKVGTIWGYELEGLFQEGEEIDQNRQKDIQNVEWGAGDIKIKDQNGDGIITKGKGTLDDHGDQVVIGNTTPRYQYGITANFTYKDFYLNLFMQGVGKRDFWPSGEAFWPAATQYYNAQKWHVYDSWTPENPDAYLPIVRATDKRNRITSDRYLQNGAYCRMKNITLGWNLPKQWIQKVYLTNASIYVSGENLFEFTKVKGPYDPESAGNSGNMSYPFMRTYSVGINLTF